MPSTLDELLALETAGWRSLCDGSAGLVYGRLMTDSAHMVLADGSVMTRDDVVASLEHAPPWASFDIKQPRLVPIADDVAALIYIGTGHRDEGPSFTASMTSVYVRGESGWRLAHYQQTPSV